MTASTLPERGGVGDAVSSHGRSAGLRPEPATQSQPKAAAAIASEYSRLPNGPDLWRAILSQMPPGAIVAGGAVRDFLLGYEPKDIDVFMALPPVAEVAAEAPLDDLFEAVDFYDPRHGLLRIENTHERFEEYAAVSNIVCVSSGTLFGYRVDAIDLDDFEGGERLIHQFDFGITRCWFDGEQIHDTPEASHDRARQCMTLLLGERVERSLARFERLRRRWGGAWRLERCDSGSDRQAETVQLAPGEASVDLKDGANG